MVASVSSPPVHSDGPVPVVEVEDLDVPDHDVPDHDVPVDAPAAAHVVDRTGADRRALIAVALVVAGVRLWVSRQRTTFSLWPDEVAQLAMARFLGGGNRWTMHNHSTWRPGYSALLSPVHWFIDDPITVFRTAMVLNALLGGIAAAMMFTLARRLTSLGTRGCALVVGVVALSPGALFVTDFVWSESLVVALFLATLVALLRFNDTPTIGSGLATAALAAAAFTTHSRMLPLVAVTIGVAAYAARRRALPPSTAAFVGAAALTATGAGALLTTAVVDRLWDRPAATNSVGEVLDRVTAIGPLLVSAAGQSWYLLVSSLGVVGFGVWGLARGIRGHDRALPRRGDAVIVAGAVGACVVLSIVFMSARTRPDHVVYGRYDDAVMAPVLIVGIATLVDHLRRRTRATIALATWTSTLLTAVVIVGFRSGPLSNGNGVEPMILGLQPFIDGAESIDVAAITVAASILMVAVAALGAVPTIGHRRTTQFSAALVAAAAAVLVVGGIRTAEVIDVGWNATSGEVDAEIRRLDDEILSGGVAIDYVIPVGSDDTKSLMSYQNSLPDNRFSVVPSPEAGTARFVLAPIDSGNGDGRRRLVWTDPSRTVSLWERV